MAGCDATKATSELKVDVDHECSICNLLFCPPVSLTCGHSYCMQCIWELCETMENVKENDGTIKCPICRAEHRIDAVKETRVNICIQNTLNNVYPKRYKQREADTAEQRQRLAEKQQRWQQQRLAKDREQQLAEKQQRLAAAQQWQQQRRQQQRLAAEQQRRRERDISVHRSYATYLKRVHWDRYFYARYHRWLSATAFVPVDGARTDPFSEDVIVSVNEVPLFVVRDRLWEDSGAMTKSIDFRITTNALAPGATLMVRHVNIVAVDFGALRVLDDARRVWDPRLPSFDAELYLDVQRSNIPCCPDDAPSNGTWSLTILSRPFF